MELVFASGLQFIVMSLHSTCVRVIMSTYTCTMCGESVTGFLKIRTHMSAIHETDIFEQPESADLEFDWAMMCPGPGHVEMNMVRSVVEFSWSIFWESMCKEFNFRSEDALKSQKKVSDHHKGWELLCIVNISMVKESAVPYVRSELSGDEKPTIRTEGFLKYIMNQKDDFTYAFIVDLVMDIISSIFMYRQGVRENIPSFVFAGRAIFAKIWSARNHPLYRELEMSDSVAFARMPPNMRDFVTKTWSINTSGLKGTGERPDFKLRGKEQGYTKLDSFCTIWTRLGTSMCQRRQPVKSTAKSVQWHRSQRLPEKIFPPRKKSWWWNKQIQNNPHKGWVCVPPESKASHGSWWYSSGWRTGAFV